MSCSVAGLYMLAYIIHLHRRQLIRCDWLIIVCWLQFKSPVIVLMLYFIASRDHFKLFTGPYRSVGPNVLHGVGGVKCHCF